MSTGDGSGHRLGVETPSGTPGPLPERGEAGWEVRELQPTGLTEDGRYLLLVAADDRGRRFRVRADERLRGLTRGATGRPGPYQPRVDSALTPREIQARLRAGHTASEVARAAGVPLERIQCYEAPMLAERARVVEQARAARPPVRGEEPRRPLGEIVAERLAQRDLGEDAAHWDAWRRVDGTWTVQMIFPRDESMVTARWLWDPAVGRVRPHDDEAAALLDPAPAPVPAPGPLPAAVFATASTPRPAPVTGPAVPANPDAVPMAPPGLPAAPGSAAPPEPPAPPLSAAPPTAPVPEAVALTLVPIASDPGSASGAHDARTALPADSHAVDPRAAGSTQDAAVDGEDARTTTAPRAPRAPGRRGRREVPAWDDIVFGAKGG